MIPRIQTTLLKMFQLNGLSKNCCLQITKHCALVSFVQRDVCRIPKTVKSEYDPLSRRGGGTVVLRFRKEVLTGFTNFFFVFVTSACSL